MAVELSKPTRQEDVVAHLVRDMRHNVRKIDNIKYHRNRKIFIRYMSLNGQRFFSFLKSHTTRVLCERILGECTCQVCTMYDVYNYVAPTRLVCSPIICQSYILWSFGFQINDSFSNNDKNSNVFSLDHSISMKFQ